MSVRSAVKSAFLLLPPVGRVSAKLDRLTSDLAHARAERGALEHELQAALEAARDGASRLDESRQVQAALMRDLNAATLRCLAAQTELADQQGEYLEAIDREIELRTRLCEIEKSNAPAAERIESLSSELEAAYARQQADESTLLRARSELEAARDRHCADEATLLALQNDLNDVLGREAALQARLHNVDQAIDLAAGEKRELLDRIAKTEAATEREREISASHAAATRELRGRIRSTLEIIGDLQAATVISDERTRVQQREAAEAEARWRDRAAELEAANARLREQLAERETAADSKEAELGAQVADIAARIAALEALAERLVAEQSHDVEAPRARDAAQIGAAAAQMRERVRALGDVAPPRARSGKKAPAAAKRSRKA